MLAAIVAWLAVLIVAVTSAGILVVRDWRWDLALLTAQYAAIAILVGQHWPVGMAAVKLVTGWMTTAALAMTLTTSPEREQVPEASWPQGRTFRLFLAGMILVLAIAATPRLLQSLSGIGAPVVTGAIILAGIGLLQMGTSGHVLRVIVGLLTVLGGFEVLYAALEGSILVAALLAGVNLGLGLVGAYLLNAAAPEEVP